MTVKEIIEKLPLDLISGQAGVNKKIQGAYASDLLSDVMGRARQGMIWITMQSHKNVMAIASLKDLAGVIVVNGNDPDDDTIKQSEEEGIPLMQTKTGSFEISGRLFELLK